jgi:hypothetical protein
MKRIPFLRSKTAILSVFLAAGVAMAIPSCKKDDNNSIPAISEGEAGELMATAVVDNNGGLMYQNDGAVGIASSYYTNRTAGRQSDDCGKKHEGSVLLESPANSNMSYKFAWNWSWLLDCTPNNEIKSLTVNYNGRIKYTTTEMSMNDSSIATFKIAGLETDSANLTLNQTFNRTGTLSYTASGVLNTYATTLSYIGSNIKVNKETGKIVGGTAAINMSGSTITGKSFSYSGTITYLGNYKATLKLKGGASVDLSWGRP